MLAHIEDFAGRPPSKSLELLPSRRLAVRALRCWEFLLPHDRLAAQRYTRLALLLGAGAGISRIRILVKPIRAVPAKSDAPPRQPLDLAEVLAKWAAVLDKPRSSCSLEEEFGVDPGVATTETGYTGVLNGGGSGGRGGLATEWPCPGAAHSAHPSRMPFTAHETRVREDLGAGNDAQRSISVITVVISELCEESS